MAVITTGSFAKALWPGVNAWWGEGYNEHQVEYTGLFDTHSSSRRYEEDVSISSFGLASRKEEGAAINYGTERQGFVTRYSHSVYALGFIITREMMEDSMYDVVGKRKARGLAFSMRQTKEVLGANIYNRAETSGYTGGDGVTLLSDSHPNIAGGLYSNKPTTDSDISEAALEQACIDIGKWTNDAGLKIAVIPQKIVIPIDSEFELCRILKSTYRVGTADNDTNALNQMSKFPKGYCVNHYLTDTDSWYIRTNVPDGMKHWVRRAAEFGIDNDWETENAKFKATERYAFGWTDPRAIYGSMGA